MEAPNINKVVTAWASNRWVQVLGCALLAAMAVSIAVSFPYRKLAARVDRQLARSTGGAIEYYSAPEIVSVGDPIASGRAVRNYVLPPQLLSDISGSDRAKRMPVSFSDLPPVLVHAILAAEDKRFFHHSGIDTLRLAKAAYVDLREHRKEQGASTITMQLARNLCLRRDKSWKRKLEETLVAIHLEHKLSKDQIFERYCNLVYLGGDASFGIIGVGEAAETYFGKDVRTLDLPEAATIAGLIQRPVYLNPLRYPRRAVARRNLVLTRMLGDRYISVAQYQAAIGAPLGLHASASQLSNSQYFVDAAAKQVDRESDDAGPPTAVYTTLDPRLQHAAERAIAGGMQLVDKQLAARHKSWPGHRPQVALIAIDPHTGEIKAFCGGRDYADSQLDRVFAKRPPGSVFKPFVYTAALNTAIAGGNPVLTPASLVDDSPASFDAGNQTYSPSNFNQEFMGEVTLRQALAHSLNVATVKVGEMVGFQNVVHIARQAGMNDDIQPTPAVALGAYQVTPFEIARAYTIFANGGTLVQPVFVQAVQDSNGGVSHRPAARGRQVLDPRVAFLMVDMLQEVMRSGTAAGVRARGFRLPAAGKTGTSHDGWFAGFTSQLLTVVWVGFDDYTDLGLEGARSALPIWTEFMSEAARYKQYGAAKPFNPPSGVTQVAVDPASGQLAGPGCGPGVASYFIDGTEPQTPCTPQEVQVIPTADGGVIEQVGVHAASATAQPVSTLPVPPSPVAAPPRR